jgi:hypothetical protein
VRCVAINQEDARWVSGMIRLRQAYLQIVPELKPFFVADQELGAERQFLGYGSPQRVRNIARSLTTTSSVVAALNSVLAGSLACDVSALVDAPLSMNLAIGAGISLVSAVMHVGYAARFRQRD